MKVWNIVSLAVLILGGLNWLLVGLFEWNLVEELFGGTDAVVTRIVYVIVGLSALYGLSFFAKVSED
ncbi:DUF378 domain-containing protein [Paenibacillus methanolicus]|uniref:DUF378 domain-containing protein n=1 Tax=Paenibacillus methanolicus TaxID=582686 RepID=A0A5S5BST7_9BACL|nr:DUF378 domain-containing protein [Paenibacillus methanolicus]TYP69366.1 hypothetical protein BCM02_11526 [Paenibacillus methanolicus]